MCPTPPVPRAQGREESTTALARGDAFFDTFDNHF